MTLSTTPVTSLSELHRVARWWTILGRPAAVTLRLPGISIASARYWEARLNKELEECGCSEGARFLTGALLVFGVYAAYRGELNWRLVGIGVGLSIGFAMLGKIWGLARAQRRLTAMISALESEAEHS